MKVPSAAAKRRMHRSQERALESHERAARGAFLEVDTHACCASRRKLVIEKGPDESRHIVAVRYALAIKASAPLVRHHGR